MKRDGSETNRLIERERRGRCRRGFAYGRVSCAYQSRVQGTSAGTQEEAKTGHSPRSGEFRQTGQNRPRCFLGTGARLLALRRVQHIEYRARKRASTRLGWVVACCSLVGEKRRDKEVRQE